MLGEPEQALAEAHALAIAAEVVVGKVIDRIAGSDVRHDLHALAQDARTTRERCLAHERTLDEETQTELLHHLNTTKDRAADLAGAWFKAGTSPREAWTFLAMGEAGEVTAWRMLGALALGARDEPLTELAAWGLQVQERHLATVLERAPLLGLIVV